MLAFFRVPVSQNKERLLPTDEDVVVKVQRGFKDEYRILVERHQNGVFFAGDAPGREPRNCGGFIAINHTRCFFKSKSYAQMRRNESFSPHKHDHSCENRAQGAEGKALERFNAALSGLRPKLREVLVLCGLEEKSYEEAGSVQKSLSSKVSMTS